MTQPETYQVLARKWRPQRFEDMVGQSAILRILTNALSQKRIHHAYLFTGTRGVGKTTLARIFAKCLNCETGITATPCDQCANCQAINRGQFIDLYEIDAASRTKVEDTRELLDNVLYPPAQGRFKVYLIDEVHMLSNHSFNALLKTLEEPPEHVKFILATTDPKRLPITVLSRCLQFHLKRILPEQIAKHLKQICATEKLSADQSALDRLAHAADGSLRDALSLLDQAIAYGHGAVTETDVRTMLGSATQDDILPLLNALAEQNGEKLFAAAQILADAAPDFQQVLEAMINTFHQLAIRQAIPNAQQVSAPIHPLSQQFSPEDIQLYYQIALLGRRDLALSPIPQQGFEMTLLRMLAFKPGLPNNEDLPEPSSLATPQTSNKTSAALIADATAPTNNSSSNNPASTVSEDSPDWRTLLSQLELSGMAHALASNCVLEKMTEHQITLALANNHEPLLNAKLKDRITEALSRRLKRPIQLDIILKSTALMTPVKQMEQEQATQLMEAKSTLLQDPYVQQLINMYDATMSVSLLKS